VCKHTPKGEKYSLLKLRLFQIIPILVTITNTSQQQICKNVGIYPRSLLFIIDIFLLLCHLPALVVISNSTNRQQVKDHGRYVNQSVVYPEIFY
jgi:hypothetical protein